MHDTRLASPSVVLAEPLGRRPIRARGSTWAIGIAGWLARLGVPPNQISIASIGFALAAAGVLTLSGKTSGGVKAALFLAAAVGIQLRLLANLLDGMVAMEGGRRSPTGELFNEVPDRFADVLILVGAGFAPGIGGGPELGWAAAALAVMTAYVRTLGASLGTPGLYIGPMAKPQRMAMLTVGCLVASVEAGLGAKPRAIALAVGLVAAGSVITIARRLAHIAARLREEAGR